MEDPHQQIHEILKAQLDAKAESLTSGTAALFFWDLLGPEKKTLTEVFGEKGDLSRKDLYERLLERTQESHQFKDWLPPKVKLNFTSSFERDCYNQGRNRLATFSIARGGFKRRGEACQESIESLKQVSES